MSMSTPYPLQSRSSFAVPGPPRPSALTTCRSSFLGSLSRSPSGSMPSPTLASCSNGLTSRAPVRRPPPPTPRWPIRGWLPTSCISELVGRCYPLQPAHRSPRQGPVPHADECPKAERTADHSDQAPTAPSDGRKRIPHRAPSRSLTEQQITDCQESVLRWLAPGPFNRLGTVRHRSAEPEPAWGREQSPHRYGSAARPRALGPPGCGESDIGRARGL